MKRSVVKPSQCKSADNIDKIRKSLRNELLSRYKEDRLKATNLRRNVSNSLEAFDEDDDENCFLDIRNLVLADQEKFSAMDEFEIESLYEDLAPIVEDMKLEILSQAEQNYFDSQESTYVDVALMNVDETVILCPICRTGFLCVTPSSVECNMSSCSMRLGVEQDCINVNSVKSYLNLAQTEHNETCNCNPIFSIEDNFGISNLFMLGSKCDFFHIVL